jgi:glycosyltransferase involved in cell wall biosynthesis
MTRRLTHVVESLEPWGTQRMLAITARRLPAAEYSQRVVALRTTAADDVNCRAELEAAGVTVDVIGRRDPDDDRQLRTMWKLRPHVRRGATDLVHLWDDASIAAAGPWIAPPQVGPAAVCSIRGPRRDLPWLPSLFERRTLLRARPIVSDPTVLAQRLTDLLRYGSQHDPAIAERTVAVPHDPIESHAVRTVAEVRAVLGVSPTTKLIGTACRLTPDANVRDLLFAAALLKLVHNDFRIVVCGDGPALEDLRRFAALMRVDDVTIFTGLTIEPDEVISALHAYVAPSYWIGRAREVGVALGSGVPIVAADTPIHRGEFEVDRSGFVFREHDQGTLTRHLHQLIEDGPLHARMAAGARELAAKFHDPDDVVQCYVEAYERALAGTGR